MTIIFMFSCLTPATPPTVMQSQGSTSSQPSFDSMSSSDSLLFSDSEQAEDDTDVFLTDSSRAGGAAASRDGGSESPGSQWACDGFTVKEEEEESYRPGSSGKAAHIGLDVLNSSSQIPKSQGDLVFAQKVRGRILGEERRGGSKAHDQCAEKNQQLIQTARPNPNPVVIIFCPSSSVSALSSRALSDPCWSC